MKIAVAGLALSHPRAFATIARQRGAMIDAVWDDDRDKAAVFAEQFDCAVVNSPAESAGRQPDGALVTCVSADHGRVSLPFLEAGVPTFVDKPFAVTRADLDLLCQSAARTGTPLASCSALRYARDYVALRESIRRDRLGALLGGAATVCHSITAYLQPGNTWQDEIARGGGSIVNMGIHGLEPLVALLGSGIAAVGCFSARRVLHASQSEDMAMIALQWRDGKTATVQVICASETHGYEVTIYGSKASARATAPSSAVQLLNGAALGTADHQADYGYTGTVQAMLEMFEHRTPPMPLTETREIILALLAARQSSATGRVVTLE